MPTRTPAGRFAEGHRASPKTEFKKGQHWRPRKPYWDREWLRREYEDRQRSTEDIARQFGIHPNSILHWMHKHDIPRRSNSEAAALRPEVDISGFNNPMFGKTGAANPNWKGGATPERQSVYSSGEWKAAAKIVWARDQAMCQRCRKRPKRRGGRGFHIHHKVSFAVNEARIAVDNLILLCVQCHRWVHSKANVKREFLDSFQPTMEAR